MKLNDRDDPFFGVPPGCRFGTGGGVKGAVSQKTDSGPNAQDILELRGAVRAVASQHAMQHKER